VYASTECLGVTITINSKKKFPLYSKTPEGEIVKKEVILVFIFKYVAWILGEVVVSSGFLFPAVQAKVIKQYLLHLNNYLYHKYQIIDMENGSILGRNKLGRLYVHTPFLMKGYMVEKGKEVKLN